MKTLKERFAKWEEVAKKQSLPITLAQCTVDLDGLTDIRMKYKLQGLLAKLAHADGTISADEKLLFDAMTARLL